MASDGSATFDDITCYVGSGERAYIAGNRISGQWEGKDHPVTLCLVDGRWILLAYPDYGDWPTAAVMSDLEALNWFEDNRHRIPDGLAELRHRRAFTFVEPQLPSPLEQHRSYCEMNGIEHEIVDAAKPDGSWTLVDLERAKRIYECSTQDSQFSREKRLLLARTGEFVLREMHCGAYDSHWCDPIFRILEPENVALELADTGIDYPGLPRYRRVTAGAMERVYHLDDKRAIQLLPQVDPETKEGVDRVLYPTHEGAWLVGEKRRSEGEPLPTDAIYYLIGGPSSVARLVEENGLELPPALQLHAPKAAAKPGDIDSAEISADAVDDLASDIIRRGAGSSDGRPRRTVHEVNELAKAFAEAHLKRMRKGISLRELARELNVNPSTLCETPFWRAYQEERRKSRPQGRKRAVPLPADRVIGQTDDAQREFQADEPVHKLIKASIADAKREPSPCDPSPRRVITSKTV
jgi:hypothetical protein